ncbi:unnamed protein product [Pleuronectes platessa]|uniref:WASH complex subunit 3 n=1 Tax=Pleuronectes platessa TaxID=8262 RepID=A0A9N7UUL8_PLEPL|nr:unnamed protein product [Pleuronectes platessa]
MFTLAVLFSQLVQSQADIPKRGRRILHVNATVRQPTCETDITLTAIAPHYAIPNQKPQASGLNRLKMLSAKIPTQTVQEAAPTQKPVPEAAAENVLTVAKDPRYARYLKMVQVGVPVMAIRNKMVLEGLDSSLLDTPDAPVPDGGARSADDPDVAATSSDSESSFSD